MKIAILSDWNPRGSGYRSIIEMLAYGLHKRGHEILIMGLLYGGKEHNHPFKVVPVEHQWVGVALNVIPKEWEADRTIVALDVDKLDILARGFEREGNVSDIWKMDVIFPVESEPLQPSWAESLGKYRNRYVLSEFGCNVCEKNELPSMHLKLGCEAGKGPEDKTEPRKMLDWPEDKTIFFSIGDNSERKNWPAALEAFKLLDEPNAHYFIVTRVDYEKGYDLKFLVRHLDLEDRVTLIPYGVSRGVISTMYWAADAVVVPSQAEGACLPIYEALAHGVNAIIAGDWTALEDFYNEGLLLSISYSSEYYHVWGTVKRWLASPSDIAFRMRQVCDKTYPLDELEQARLKFIEERSWSSAVDILEKGYE